MSDEHRPGPEPSRLPLTQSLTGNLDQVKRAFGTADDMVVREIRLGSNRQVRVAVLFMEGLVNTTTVDDAVIRPLQGSSPTDRGGGSGQKISAESIRSELLAVSEVTEAATAADILDGLLNGRSAVLIDGEAKALLAATVGWKTRPVGETKIETTVRGSREAFNEDLTSNVAAVRRRIRHPRLQVERMQIGSITRTGVAVLYIEGMARPEVLADVRGRLKKIRIDSILEGGYIEEFIEDHRWSPFPQIEHTERPDKVAGSLLEGRVAIATDGTPAVLLVPTGLFQLLQASEDYYERYPFAMSIRFLRLLAMMAALYFPSLYVAVISYHQEMIPLNLALRFAASRDGAPFPAIFEALLMEFAFELLREAGLRLPRPVGQAVSIVGGLIIGDAAVRAGLVGPPMVVVVAITGIASFAVPAFNLALSFRLLRFGIMVAAGVAGLPGITLTGLAITYHLTSLRSFGVPYLSPVAPGHARQWKDLLVRAPWWAQHRRSSELSADSQRQPVRRVRGPRRPR